MTGPVFSPIRAWIFSSPTFNALYSASFFCTERAATVAATGDLKYARIPSPIFFTTRPWYSSMAAPTMSSKALMSFIMSVGCKPVDFPV